MDSDLSLENFLRYEDLIEARSDLESLKYMASKLYACDKKDIDMINKDDNFYEETAGMHRFDIDFMNRKKAQFYVKNSWEGGLREAIGMEIMNLLSDTKINYFLMGEKVVLMDHIKGIFFSENTQMADSSKFWFALGAAQEYAKFLGLSDRREENLIFTEDMKCFNIDFGQIFYNDGKTYSGIFWELPLIKPLTYLFRITLGRSPLEDGKTHAKNHLYKNLKKHSKRIKGLYEMAEKNLTILVNHPQEVLENYCRAEGWVF